MRENGGFYEEYEKRGTAALLIFLRGESETVPQEEMDVTAKHLHLQGMYDINSQDDAATLPRIQPLR